jgi:hypothetical protein
MPDRMTPRLLVWVSFALLLCTACGDLPVPGRSRIVSDDAELRTSARRMLRTVERLSGLKAKAPIHVARQSENELRGTMYESMRESRADIEAAIEAYVILGLAPADLDVASIEMSQVSAIDGYYDHRTKRLYVLTKVDPILVELVLVHELVHALQDQYVDLAAGLELNDADESFAFRAAVEGHASLVMAAWLIEDVTGERTRPSSMPSLADEIRRSPVVPTFGSRDGMKALERIFMFPYVEGSSFVRTLWKHRPDRLAIALDSLRPRSTEQVLNPERSLLGRRDEPMAIPLALPPEGWTARYEDTIGEYVTRLTLEENLGSNAATAAGGWRGDRLRVLDDGAGARVLQWVRQWKEITFTSRCEV